MMTLDEAREHIGDRVAYRPDYGAVEFGRITSANGTYVFVAFSPSAYAESLGSACRPEALTLTHI